MKLLNNEKFMEKLIERVAVVIHKQYREMDIRITQGKIISEYEDKCPICQSLLTSSKFYHNGYYYIKCSRCNNDLQVTSNLNDFEHLSSMEKLQRKAEARRKIEPFLVVYKVIIRILAVGCEDGFI